MSQKQAKFKSSMELNKAVQYLQDLVASLRQGTVSVANGAHGVTLHPKPLVKVEFEAEQKPEREAVSIRISWEKENEAEAADFRVTAAEKSSEPASSS